jgi:hypothetical protein
MSVLLNQRSHIMKVPLLVTLAIVISTCNVSFAQSSPPPPGGGGGSTNNTPPSSHVPAPRPVVDGLIHTETLDVIEWYNFDSRVFTVEHRQTLTDGSWASVGEGYKGYVHNNPEGFYRVIKSPTDVVFPVWNSGTSNLLWTASTTSEWATIECLNTNIPPEWGEGYVIVRTFAPEGTNIIIDVYAGEQHQQLTVVVN